MDLCTQPICCRGTGWENCRSLARRCLIGYAYSRWERRVPHLRSRWTWHGPWNHAPGTGGTQARSPQGPRSSRSCLSSPCLITQRASHRSPQAGEPLSPACRLPPDARVLVVPVPWGGIPLPLRWQAETGEPASIIGGDFISPGGLARSARARPPGPDGDDQVPRRVVEGVNGCPGPIPLAGECRSRALETRRRHR